MEYLKNPSKIYEQSFAIIRAEADFDGLPEDIERVAVRLIHACGMTDLVDDLRYSEGISRYTADALNKRSVILTDSKMTKAAIIAKHLPRENKIICTLNRPEVPSLATENQTTRSAAAIRLWEPLLADAVVVIGNAPTALFALLEALDAGYPKPAAILAFPVGFVGAAESKQALADNPRGIPFMTLLGRRGGSAMAGAALNSISLGTRQ